MKPNIVFGTHDEKTLQQLDNVLQASGPDAMAVLCADGHLGYGMPIGGVIASQHVIMPGAVGFDIACGNMAVETDALVRDIDRKAVMDEVWKTISFGVGRKNNEKADDVVLEHIARDDDPSIAALASKAAEQLGTVGSGNHYVDLFEDHATGRLWVGVHFGSRGFGHTVATGFLNRAVNQPWGARLKEDLMATPAVIPMGSDLGTDYIAAMQLAGRYAYAGRTWVVNRVLRILDNPRVLQSVHNHHNFAWFEQHGPQWYMVTRKGATPAAPGQKGFIGGSMGDDAVIVEGVEGPLSQLALYSTVHGAGRAMSRTQAAGKFNRKTGEQKAPGLIDWPETLEALRVMGIELRGGGADEAPGAYKRLPDVLAAHEGTIRILHTLRPIGVAMAGRETYDPYRD